MLPIINVEQLLAGSSPKFCYIENNKEKAIHWALYEYNKTNRQKEIANRLGVPYQTILHWFKKYGIYKPFDKKLNQKIFLRTPEFSKEVQRHRSQGIVTYEKLAKVMKCDPSVISKLARIEGWSHFKNKCQFNIPKNKQERFLLNYKEYQSKIYRYTYRISWYLPYEDQYLLADTNMQIDHKISIYEAFHNEVGPIAWQYICHPCNLQIITAEENRIKDRYSCINSDYLFNIIEQYKKQYGRIKLPMSKTLPKLVKEGLNNGN